MKISFVVQVRNDNLIVSKAGDTLMINGELFDFTNMPDGAKLPVDALNTSWILGDVNRINGEIELTLFAPVPNLSGNLDFPPLINPADGVIIDTTPAPEPEDEVEENV